MYHFLRTAWFIVLAALCSNAMGQQEGDAFVDSLERSLHAPGLSKRQQTDMLSRLCFEYKNIQPTQGIHYGEAALRLAAEAHYPEKLGDIYLSLASCYNYTNDIVKSYEYSLEAIKYNHQYGSDDVSLYFALVAKSYNPNIAPDQQRAFLDSVLGKLSICKDPLWRIRTMGYLSNSYLYISGPGAYNIDRADSLCRIALAEAKSHHQRYLYFLNFSRTGGIYHARKKYDSAISIFQCAMDSFPDVCNKRVRCEQEWEIAACYYEWNQQLPDKARLLAGQAHLAVAIKLAAQLGYQGQQLFNYTLAADIARELHQMDSAYFFSQQYIALNDTLYGQKARARLEKIAILQRDELKGIEIARQRTIIYFSAGILVLLIIVVLLSLRANHTQKRLNNTITKLVTAQEETIRQRTQQLAQTNDRLTLSNARLVELIRYNAHNLREPLARIMGAMIVKDYLPESEFYAEIWPQMEKAVTDLDNSIKDVIHIADETIDHQADKGKDYSEPA